jgi:hypothetical protein
MMNLETLRESVRTRLGVPEADNFYTAPILDDLVNEAIQAIALEEDWPWLQSSATLNTVAGTQSYTPPVNVGHVWSRTRGLARVNDDVLEWHPLKEIRGAGDGRGIPIWYCITQEQLILAPIPSSALQYTHDYIRQEPILVNNEDAPVMPIPFRYAIVHLAASMGYARQNEDPRAAAEMSQYQAWLKRMQDNRRRSAAPARVRVRPGAMWLNGT